MQDIGVVYLYRFAEGEAPVKRFLESYRTYPAGIAHDLHIIFKGFPSLASLERGRAIFDEIAINSIEVDDTHYDIGSYISAAKVIQNSRLIFMNTFSEILAPDWLAKFDRALRVPKVGLVGATGSWQANTSSYERVLYSLLSSAVYWPDALRNLRARIDISIDQSLGKSHRPKRPWHRYFLSPIYYVYYLYAYGRFPNPHIRTNAFMIERDRFLSLRFPSFIKKKSAYRFESGRHSLTKQIMAQGLDPVVIDLTGKIYGIDEWKSSATFWIAEQENLIVADNRTRDYMEGSAEFRNRLEVSAWKDPWT